eukprot:354135-Chlamydomonas_euryale.AAC.4
MRARSAVGRRTRGEAAPCGHAADSTARTSARKVCRGGRLESLDTPCGCSGACHRGEAPCRRVRGRLGGSAGVRAEKRQAGCHPRSRFGLGSRTAAIAALRCVARRPLARVELQPPAHEGGPEQVATQTHESWHGWVPFRRPLWAVVSARSGGGSRAMRALDASAFGIGDRRTGGPRCTRHSGRARRSAAAVGCAVVIFHK